MSRLNAGNTCKRFIIVNIYDRKSQTQSLYSDAPPRRRLLLFETKKPPLAEAIFLLIFYLSSCFLLFGSCYLFGQNHPARVRDVAIFFII